ncbi:MAG TPA: preprotein translocase subunit YajC [Wolbachia sp.]|uniref:preprotein translocase subunit YajC n=1 Tax=Wolbachia endosymbiont of Pentalonia nigronervosa TaxID=1301914 RepID=UPI000EED72E8|nr:preprotein translocase subunit YajC [Wolbachia endosymbiont of Pentalonia nigronervosa]MBD0391182.1 preprotein translocase subunit YajC [Wolbachia endosymbiont of Pentalonia nigronervosa]HCE59263.1 preprotein translocase subunit YajC [Wolbachia sp.]
MFISEAFAAGSTSSTSSIGSSFVSFVPLVLLFLVFYFLIIRPQQKRLKEHKRIIDLIKRGDSVVTSGGIIGEVNKVDETNGQFIVEIAPKVEIKVLKSAISEVLTQKTVAQTPEKSKVESSNKKNKEKPANGTQKKNDENKSKDA